MKFVSLFAAIALADDETPHDPEAMAYCQGKPDGFYQNVKDCQSYFFCWGQGQYAPSSTLCSKPVITKVTMATKCTVHPVPHSTHVSTSVTGPTVCPLTTSATSHATSVVT